MKPIGALSCADLSGCDPEQIDDVDAMRRALVDSCRAAGAVVLRTVAHRFLPQGVTVVCVLAESHAALHTYPELGRCMVDVFTCGDKADPDVALDRVVGRIRHASVARIRTPRPLG